jgi:calmodulin
VLQKAFNCFDSGKTGSISVDTVADILRLMGQPFNKQILDELIEEVDEDSEWSRRRNDKLESWNISLSLLESGRLEFEEFVQLAAKFIVEEDEEAMAKELREAFRLYDKEGNGFIPTTCLKEILRELDDQLSDEDLDNMIQEIDSDGSGTVDFDGEYLYTQNIYTPARHARLMGDVLKRLIGKAVRNSEWNSHFLWFPCAVEQTILLGAFYWKT